MTRTDDIYDPPVTDPRTDANQEWTRMRNELLALRDSLREVTAMCETQAIRISTLTDDLKRARACEAEAIRETISYRTSLEDVGRLVLAILKRGIDDRKGGDPYAPPAIPTPERGQPIEPSDIEKVEQLLRRR